MAFTPCRDAILDQLRDDLQQASRPETRIGGAFRAGQIARLIRQEEERRLEEQLAAVRRRLDQAHRTVESRRRSLDFHAAASADHRQKCDLLAELRIAASDLRLPEPPQWIEHATADTAQEVRKELTDRYAAAWSGWLRRVTPHFSPYPRWSDVTPYGAVAIRTRVAAAAVIIPRLHTQPLGNMIERYRRHLAARMVQAYRAATARLEDLLGEHAGADLDRIAADLDQSGVLLVAGHQAAECRHTAARAMVRKVEEDLRWAEDECCGGRQRLSAAVGVAEGFPTLLRSYYERQWRQARHCCIERSVRPS
ncbi:MAG: hypothetical protein ACRDRU_10650 [Pseudonocardiaceae bacterium]